MKIETVSASKIKSHNMCEFKYYLENHLKIDLGTNFGAEQGSLAHTIYEEFGRAFKEGIKDPEIAKTWLDKILESYRDDKIWEHSVKALIRDKSCDSCEYCDDGKCFILDLSIDKFPGCPKEEFNQTIWLVEKIINDRTPSNPLNSKIIDVENKFKIILKDGSEEVPMTGIIDLVCECDSNTLEIVDYKTGNKTQSYNECVKDIQFLMYHLATRHMYPNYKNIIVTAIYLKREPISMAFSVDDEEETRMYVKKKWYEIKQNISPKRIADRSNGSVYFNHICKNLCNIEICKCEHEKFVRQGGVIVET
jgi:RecB family exonuclease